MSKIIISDTSCLIALDRIGRLDLLQKIFTNVYTTKIIALEFEENLPDWIIIKDVADLDKIEQLKVTLDPGEASAITLALETENSVLIIDEKKGRKVAVSLNIAIIGTLKVLLIAKNRGFIVSVKEIVNEMQYYSFRFSKTVVDEILSLAGDL